MIARPICYLLNLAALVTAAAGLYLGWQALPAGERLVAGRIVSGHPMDMLLMGWAIGTLISAAVIGGLAAIVQSLDEIRARVVYGVRFRPQRSTGLLIDDETVRRHAASRPRMPGAGWN